MLKLLNRIQLNAGVLMVAASLIASPAQAVTKGPPFTQADCADPTLSLKLKTQADVDGFPCTAVAGDLIISPDPSQPLSPLSPGLDGLTQVDGELRLSFNNDGAPSTLAGLDNLT